MKKLILILALTFTSSTAFAEWTEVFSDESGDTFYLDYDTDKKHDGFVYWWHLNNYLKPDKYVDMSGKTYNQGECGPFRYKPLSYIYYKQPMANGTGEINSPKNPEWKYPSPDTVIEGLLKLVCEQY